jgi:hypothetical protein
LIGGAGLLLGWPKIVGVVGVEVVQVGRGGGRGSGRDLDVEVLDAAAEVEITQFFGGAVPEDAAPPAHVLNDGKRPAHSDEEEVAVFAQAWPLDDAADRTGVDVGEDKRVATMEDLERDRRGEDVMVGGGEVGIERAYGVEVRHRADRGALHSEDVAAIDRDVGNDRRCIVMTMQTRARAVLRPDPGSDVGIEAGAGASWDEGRR